MKEPVRYFETHCHLNDSRFGSDRAEAIARARAAGVSEFVEIGFDLPSSAAAVRLAEQAPDIFAAIGVHPHGAADWSAAAELQLRQFAKQPQVVAIGEIGLDFYRDLSPRDVQRAAFQAQLALAEELHFPIIIHSREAMDESLDMIEPFARRGLRGIMHCWSGTLEQARRARELGLHLGFGGVVTYKKSFEQVEVVKECPTGTYVLETDCPYLAPEPHRGRRNEPAYLPLIAERLALVRNETQETVAKEARETAARLFRVKKRQ